MVKIFDNYDIKITYLAVVSDEFDPVSRINCGRAKIAFLQTHGGVTFVISLEKEVYVK